MRNEHILDILDEKVFGELSKAEKTSIETHAAHCSNCSGAYRAARIGAVLLKMSVAQNFEPSPFFQSRVMANLREQQISNNPLAVLGRLWKASRTVVAMMTTIVAALIAVTIFAPEFNKVSSANIQVFDGYSTEMVILNERVPMKEPTNEQVLQIIYGTLNGAEK